MAIIETEYTVIEPRFDASLSTPDQPDREALLFTEVAMLAQTELPPIYRKRTGDEEGDFQYWEHRELSDGVVDRNAFEVRRFHIEVEPYIAPALAAFEQKAPRASGKELEGLKRVITDFAVTTGRLQRIGEISTRLVRLKEAERSAMIGWLVNKYFETVNPPQEAIEPANDSYYKVSSSFPLVLDWRHGSSEEASL